MSASIVIRVLLLLACLGWTLAAAPAAAQAGLAGSPVDACITRALPADTPQALFGVGKRFNCTTRQTDLGEGDYWALSAPLPAHLTADGRTHVRVLSLSQASLDLHVLYADGVIRSVTTTSATLGRHIALGAIVDIALPRRNAAPVRLLWRIGKSDNRRGILLGQRIATERESAQANLLMAGIYAAFGGLAFALLIYNLALWWALRHRFQLAYCAMNVALIGYALTSSGALAWIVPALDNNDRMRLNYVLLGLASASAIIFARTFFERRVFAGWLGPATCAAAAVMVLGGVTFAVGSHVSVRVADPIASGLFLLGLSVTAPILWSAWRRGSRFLRLFALAWAVPIMFAFARILASFNLIPSTFWLDNSTVLSLAFEALMSSLAIAYRVQMLSHERDQARAGELQARELADADPLTGLLNRRSFLDRAIGLEGTRVLHLIDIDHFKRVNETLGHDGGDEVLRVFARTLRSAARPGDLIARLGGEEFAILSSASAAIDGEALLTFVRAARMPFDLRVTASVGTCTGPLLIEAEWNGIYRNADRALFEAKSAGRDRARTAPSLAIAA